MERILEQAKNLGTLVSSEQELKDAGFEEGKKVLAIISRDCFRCKTVVGSLYESSLKVKRYLSEKEIGLLFIERNNSFSLAREWGDGSYPNVYCYNDGKQVGWRFAMIYANEFIEWLKQNNF